MTRSLIYLGGSAEKNTETCYETAATMNFSLWAQPRRYRPEGNSPNENQPNENQPN